MKIRHILMASEFLRESKALYDNLYPSRIIVGTDLSNAEEKQAAETFADMLDQGARKENIPILCPGPSARPISKRWLTTSSRMMTGCSS